MAGLSYQDCARLASLALQPERDFQIYAVVALTLTINEARGDIANTASVGCRLNMRTPRLALVAWNENKATPSYK